MKKLMTAFAAVGLCAAVFADVTSANVVGYQNNAVEQGYSLRTPVFYAVGGGAIDIQSILPTGANVPTGKDHLNFVQFEFLNEKSEVKDLKTYYWHDYTTDKIMPWDVPYTCHGWYTKMAPNDPDDGKVAALPIKAGDAFYLFCANAEVSLQFAGEVDLTDANITVEKVGYALVGNPFPVDVKLNDITPMGEDDQGQSIVPTGKDHLNFVQFEFLNEKSEVKDLVTYYWHDYTTDKIMPWDVPYTCHGWYTKMAPNDPNDGKVADTALLKSGEGVYLYSAAAGVKMNIKGPNAN